jgi:hypothetical protein
MDALRESAIEQFQGHNEFAENESNLSTRTYELIQILAPGTQQTNNCAFPVIPENQLSAYMLEFATSMQETTSKPSLAMVVVPRDDFEEVQISKSTFLDMWRCCGLDPYLLVFIQQNWYGVYASPTQYQGRFSMCIGTVLYCIVLSFDPRTASTMAICLPRDSNGWTSGREVILDLKKYLERSCVYTHSPSLIPLVALLQLTQWLGDFIYDQLTRLRDAEMKTGHGPYGGVVPEPNLGELKSLSRDLGELLITIANNSRHQQIGMDISRLLRGSSLSVWEQLLDATISSHDGQVRRKIEDAIDSLEQQMRGNAYSIEYLQSRAQTQMPIVSLHFVPCTEPN